MHPIPSSVSVDDRQEVPAAGPVLPCRFKFFSVTVAGAFDMGTGQAYVSLRTLEPLEFTGFVDVLFGRGEQPLLEDVEMVDGKAVDLTPMDLHMALSKLERSQILQR